MADLARLRAIVAETDPQRVADRVPLVAPMEKLLGRGLKRGSVVAIEGETARSSLAMVLLAGVSAAGGWCGVVGVPSFGCLAAKGFGVRLEALALVPRPGEAWAEVVSTFVAGMDAVLVSSPERVPGRLARRLAAKARQSRCTVLTMGPVWEGSDVRVSAIRQEWFGLGRGSGRLESCRVTAVASNRPRTKIDLWLPARDGSAGVAEAAAAPSVLPRGGRQVRAG